MGYKVSDTVKKHTVSEYRPANMVSACQWREKKRVMGSCAQVRDVRNIITAYRVVLVWILFLSNYLEKTFLRQFWKFEYLLFNSRNC